MEKQVKQIRYIGIDRGRPRAAHGEKENRVSKGKVRIVTGDGVFPFRGGRIQLSTLLFDAEFLEQKGWLSGRLEKLPGKWGRYFRYRDRRRKQDFIEKMAASKETEEKPILLWEEKLFAFLGAEREQELPLCLWACCLQEKIKADRHLIRHISLSFPAECGPLILEDTLWLLAPYLRQIDLVIYVGEENECVERLEDYLYEEYGSLVSYEKKPEKNTLWLDWTDKSSGSLQHYAAENGIYHLNRRQVWNFLDTAAKNGYNTEVNWTSTGSD